ncbi:dihydrolipoyllysine-residue acetyltransferase [methane-oxidizing endosymbiont of Gigantopelta aegis]|uniref:dihydrolipoyllysine-residue acetyltransferase n=1 Tax=methane-oxidizing endosymbiont of Gigantopelta aegis TaxID=2794938 RepID=UPI0018DBC514|nr:dihydrolipoyllysine-residue acetyltransferase [methane-oxidizing endosymbiont of Gigantopelta aegis]
MATQEIKVPDLGNVDNIDVIEVLVHPGDKVELEQTLAVLETDKATMDLPASATGVVEQVHIKVGDKVSEGTLVVTLNSSETSSTQETEEKTETKVETPETQPTEPPAATAAEPVKTATQPTSDRPPLTPMSNAAHKIHATPSVRLFARELGVDIHQIPEGSGRKGRILKDDVKKFVKSLIQSDSAKTGTGISPIPAVDFSQFGEIEEKPLSKIKKLTGQNMTRVWLNLPMVTYHDEVDITELEAFRKATNADKNNDIRLTALVFIMKALVAAMKQFPAFNSSLSADGESLIFKHYFHIGIAVDTPNGLVVPVIRDVDKKGIFQLSEELAEKSALARKGRLMPQDMQGGCMTISSLGGIGGTAFTPIVNAPEVAILGVTRAKMQPVWDGEQFIPRLMLPLDLSYDHRVIDGAEGARFMEAVKSYLGDIRRLIL